MSRTTILRICLAIGSLLLGLAAAEWGLRLHHAWRITSAGSLRDQLERSRAAPLEQPGERRSFRGLGGLVRTSSVEELVYELKPGLDGYFKGGAVRTNSWGFRSAEVDLEKPPGVFRIAGLGDSFMFGWGVHQDEPYLAVLERSLNAGGGARFEVLNLAVPGYNTALEVEMFAAKGVVFEPDLVIIHFYSNDLGLPDFMLEPREVLEAREGLYLAALVRGALNLSSPRDAQPRALLAHDRIERQERTVVEDAYQHMIGREAYRQSMARLAGLTRERSIPVVVIELEEYFDFELKRVLRQVAAENDFYLLEPRSRFLAHLQDSGMDASRWRETFHVSERDVHLNKLGHSVMAEALVEFLVENRLVPVPESSGS